MTNTQAAERQARHECMQKELIEALEEAIGLIDCLDGRDNSCDPLSDISDLRAVLARAKEQQ